MNRHSWLPVQGDSGLDVLSYNLAGNPSFRARELKKPEHWNEISGGDTVMIIGHGRMFSTEQMGWKQKDGPPVFWRYDALADRIVQNLTEAQTQVGIVFDLIMCYSGDKVFGECFAGHLAGSLGGRCRGWVHGYKGSVVSFGHDRGLIVNGRSRITSLINRNIRPPANGRSFFREDGTVAFFNY